MHLHCKPPQKQHILFKIQCSYSVFRVFIFTQYLRDVNQGSICRGKMSGRGNQEF